MILQQTKGLTSPFVSSSVETDCVVLTSRAEINLAGTHSLNGQMHAKPVNNQDVESELSEFGNSKTAESN